MKKAMERVVMVKHPIIWHHLKSPECALYMTSRLKTVACNVSEKVTKI